MTINSNSAQIRVDDTHGGAGVNVWSDLSGYAVDLSFWGGQAYVARKEGDPFVHVLVVPSERWEQDLKDEGWIIVGTLKDLAATPTS